MTSSFPNQTIPDPGFFEKYFINPIIERTGYTSVNTLAYGVLLVLGAYTIFKFLKKLGYKVDFRFFKASTPFILLVSVWRAMTDAGFYPYNFITTTPGLYLPVLLLFFPLVALAKKIEDEYEYKYEWIYSGVSAGLLISQLILMSTLIPTHFKTEAAMLVIYYLIISGSPIVFLSIYWKPLKNKLNFLMLITHMFDASVTHVSLTYYNYFEQHVIPRFFFGLFGTSLSFYLLKLIVLGTVIYFLDKEKGKDELRDFVKMIFIIYGIGTGVRGFLRLSFGV